MVAVGRCPDRRGRRHGVDDQRAVPRAWRSCWVPLRQCRARRRHRARWPVVLVRRLPDGHRHGQLHGRQHQPRRDGRGRGGVARAGRDRDQGRPARRGDRPGLDSATAGRPDRRRARRGRPARHDRGEPRCAASCVRRGWHDHRRQRLADQRRRLGSDRDVGRARRCAWCHAARRDRVLRHGRRAGQADAQPAARQRHPRRARQDRSRRSTTCRCSSSTRRSPRSASHHPASSASRWTSSTSTAARSRSGIRSA